MQNNIMSILEKDVEAEKDNCLEIEELAIEDSISRIIKGDCIEELSKLENESVDLIFADPPYFMQTEGNLLRTDGSVFSGVDDKWDKFNSYEDYDNFSYKWLKECKRILKPNGSIWVIGSFQNIYRLGYIMQNLGYWILNDVIWSKPNAVPNFAGTRFQNSHETLLWCTKSKNAKYTFNYKTMKHLNGGKQDKSVWDVSICIGNERLKDEDGKKVHSTQKPETLLEKVILSSSKPNDIVLDPFFGTGTTGAIAKRYNRYYIGIEREDKYIEAASKRIRNEKVIRSAISDLSLEVIPPKVSTKSLIESKLLNEDEELFNNKGMSVGRITENGNVLYKEQELSIHKASALCLNKANHNGWDYFYIKRDGVLKSINNLRYEFIEQKGAVNG